MPGRSTDLRPGNPVEPCLLHDGGTSCPTQLVRSARNIVVLLSFPANAFTLCAGSGDD